MKVEERFNQWFQATNGNFVISKTDKESLIKTIAKSVQEERERCAKIIYRAEPVLRYAQCVGGGECPDEGIDKDQILSEIFETDGKSDDHPNRKALAQFYKEETR